MFPHPIHAPRRRTISRRCLTMIDRTDAIPVAETIPAAIASIANPRPIIPVRRSRDSVHWLGIHVWRRRGHVLTRLRWVVSRHRRLI
jgi:hypothetical protein